MVSKVRTRGRCGFCSLVDFLPHKCGEVIKERRLERERAAARRKPRQELHVLYRFFDGDGGLLYVGITNNLWHRVGSHSELQLWWSQVATATVEHYPDRRSLSDAERVAIKTEHPRHNKAYVEKRCTTTDVMS
jgi:predicted GIY-YIG superfamily endonuclease